MEESKKNMILQMENASFTYKSGAHSDTILENISLTTRSSEICAIVGPSGCGKTTLIKLAISLLPLTSGSVKLFGRDAGDPSVGIPGPNVGYMPQEVSLPQDLRVRNSLYFFGLLNNMSLKELKTRITEVLEQVDLVNSESEYIFRLSGGMKRRLSLAITMLHSPKLLILDEPTVGSDPIIQKRIWKILKNMSKQNGTSIVITTHYYEECREADYISFMRAKTFLFQASPERVMQATGTKNLDEAFFKLCHAMPETPSSFNDEQQSICDHVEDNALVNCSSSFPEPPKFGVTWMKIIVILVFRYLHSLFSDPFSVLCVLSLPTTSLILAHICTSPRILDAPVGLVIENQTLTSYEVIFSQFNMKSNCSNCFHPEHFADFIDHTAFKVIPYKNLQEAIEDVEMGRINGVIHIGDQFSENYINRVITHWSDLDDTVVEKTKVTLYADASKTLIFRFLEVKLLDAYNKFWQASRRDLRMANDSMFPFDYGETVIGSKKDETNPKNYYSDTGQLISYTLTTLIAISALSIMRELRDETMKRCISMGVKTHHLLLAQFAANGIVFGICSFASMITTIYLLDIPFKASLLVSALLLLCQNAVGILLGQMLAVTLFSEVTVMVLVSLLSFPLVALCGLHIPVQTQPYYVRIISDSLPFTILAKGIRDGILRKDNGQNCPCSDFDETYSICVIKCDKTKKPDRNSV